LEYDVTAPGRQKLPDRDAPGDAAAILGIALSSDAPQSAVTGEIGVTVGHEEVLPENYGADMFLLTSAGHDEKYAKVNEGQGVAAADKKIRAVWTDKSDPSAFAPYRVKLYLKCSRK
jgi:hypothetical protein